MFFDANFIALDKYEKFYFVLVNVLKNICKKIHIQDYFIYYKYNFWQTFLLLINTF